MSNSANGLIHTVVAGEWISKIAAHYGFNDWKRLWNAPENAELRKTRPDPNLIHPGDKVYIPPIDPDDWERGTDAEHKFVLKTHKKRLRIKLETVAGKPRAHLPCRLLIDHRPCPGVSQTDSHGIVDALISDQAKTGMLLVGQSFGECYAIKLGHLDPLYTVRGYQGRLHNLGHYRGEVDGVAGPMTKAAIRAFQERENLIGYSPALKVDGIMGPKTTQALLRRHGY
jgi:N-acetylmuramoyl-L-alanine amidase